MNMQAESPQEEQTESPDDDAQEQQQGLASNPQLGALIESTNIAEKLTVEELEKIGKDAKAGFDIDSQSRQEWECMLDEWTKLAKQVIEEKSYPWPNASNIKYPLLSTAAMQFAARAYPSLLPSDGKVVKSKVIGKDPDGSKTLIAEAVSTYMSYQLMDEMDGWEEDMDKLLIMLPILGTMFKKTYWDPIEEKNCSRLVLPKNLVVNYWAKSLCDAERISEILEINERQFKERQQSGLWIKKKDYSELSDPSLSELTEFYKITDKNEVLPNQDGTTPYLFAEQHTYLDLDKDGYKEPYIVTFHLATSKVFRIVARYDDKTMFFTDDGKLARIKPIEYYTKYGFVPNPDGSFYDIGFGTLLGPINESVNTLINQLIDAGTLNNLQSGFIGKGLRIRMGETRFNPGEWKAVNSTGDDLKKQIVPLPTKEPSTVLFSLVQFLVTAGKELASVAEIFVGKMPGQNTPATTTMASIEQGMKVFTAVYKRIYRAMGEEFQKLYRLNKLYINPQTEVGITGMKIDAASFNDEDHKIMPGADPTAVSQTEKLLKAQGLMEMLSSGLPLNPVEVTKRMLQAQEQPNWEQLLPPQVMQTGQMPPPPPDPKVVALQAKAQADSQAAQQEAAIRERESTIDMAKGQQDLQSQAALSQIKVQEAAQLAHIKTVGTLAHDQARIDQAHSQAAHDAQASQQVHQQTMQQNEEMHQARLRQVRQQAAAKPAPKGGTKK